MPSRASARDSGTADPGRVPQLQLLRRRLAGKPALFTHNEVITLFHEFGHGLHHLLTRVEHRGVSGINGVEWDAVELPSQFMENFCWEWDVVQGMSAHVETRCDAAARAVRQDARGEEFPERPAVRAAAGVCAVRHAPALRFRSGRRRFTPLQLLERRAQAGGGDRARRNTTAFPNSFSHIFAGGYAAGYYSYKWAEVLSADAYSLFEEMGVLSPRGRRALPSRDPERRGQPAGARIVRRLPRPRAQYRRACCAIAA